jgi:hypothetical protein
MVEQKAKLPDKQTPDKKATRGRELECSDVEFYLEVREKGSLPPLLRERVEPGHLQPLVEDAIWSGQRSGTVGDYPGELETAVRPVFGKALPGARGAQDVVGFRVDIRQDDRQIFTREYGTDVVRNRGQLLLQSLLEAKRLEKLEMGELRVVVGRPQPSATSPSATSPSAEASRNTPPGAVSFPKGRVRLERRKLAWSPGQLSTWQAGATLVNEAAFKKDDVQIFIRRQAFEAARTYCSAAGPNEAGALLVGRVFRQVEPYPELFAVIEAAVEARHAEQTQYSLTPTTETYVHFERQLERRREHLGRPEEMQLGIAHGHRFLPAMGADGKPLCPACPSRATCELDSAFYSTDDEQFHRALYATQPYAVGIVFGLTPREEDKVRIYRFSGGLLAERSLWQVE